MTFKELGLSAGLLSALDDAGYTEPTPIQAGAIPHALAGRDVLGIAQTGTGKTASFVLPMIEKLSRGRARARMPRSLIIEPTRELAAQVAENFEKYAKNYKLNMALLIGGVAFGPQEKILNSGADVLIATPGRLLDHFGRGKLLLSGVQIMVVDEADRMLDMGFIPDIERIFKMVPPRRQTLFFSATMPKEIQSLVATFLNDPQRVEVSRPATAATTVSQYVVRVPDRTPKAKRDLLHAALRRPNVKNGIIFCNRKRDVDIVARALKKEGFSADPIHGDLDQSQRTATLDRFKKDELRFLVASDVAARGLDIPAVSHVFNFDVPHQADDYVHRIGRTGRAGLTGEAITLVGPEDSKALAAIERLAGSKIDTLDPHGGASKAAAQPVSQDTGEEAEAVTPGEARSSGRRRRGRKLQDESSSRKSERTARPVKPVVEEAAPPEPLQPVTPLEPEPRPARRREPRTASRPGAQNEDRDTDGAPTGFGEHIPDFIRRI